MNSGASQQPATLPTVENGEQALQRLVEGNRRYVEDRSLHPNQSKLRAAEVARVQKPIAAILGCADSRVPTEIIFDQGIGDLFVVRVAGNVLDSEDVIASLEYAAVVLKVPLLLVLGHERCGAVQATLDKVRNGGVLPGHIGKLVEAIRPAVERTAGMPGDPLDNAVRANVRMVVASLKSSNPLLSELAASGKLTIAGARFDLDTGEVEIVE